MQSVKFDADKKLIDYIQKRVNKLDKIYERITDGEVIMRVEKSNQIPNKSIEFKINIPGEQLFVKEKSRSFEAATDKAVDSLMRQLKKYKDKKIGR